MISTAAVLEAFASLAQLTPKESQTYESLCADAARWVFSRIRAGADLTGEGQRMTLAAAACAYYRFCLLTASADASFSAGSIKYTASGGKNALSARQLMDVQLASIADLIRDDQFYCG